MCSPEKKREYRKRDYDKNSKRYIEQAAEWKKNNPDRVRESSRRYRKNHADQIREAARVYLLAHRGQSRERTRRYQEAHPEVMRRINREYAAKHPERKVMSHAVQSMLSRSGKRKDCRVRQYVGCSPEFLRNHLESLFRPGMTWANYGQWHVDHIVPLSWFPIEKDESLLFVASHWSNLQPLWASENSTKYNRYT